MLTHITYLKPLGVDIFYTSNPKLLKPLTSQAYFLWDRNQPALWDILDINTRLWLHFSLVYGTNRRQVQW